MSNETNKTKTKKSSGYKTSQDKEIEKMLVSGEEVILRAQLHWAI